MCCLCLQLTSMWVLSVLQVTHLHASAIFKTSRFKTHFDTKNGTFQKSSSNPNVQFVLSHTVSFNHCVVVTSHEKNSWTEHTVWTYGNDHCLIPNSFHGPAFPVLTSAGVSGEYPDRLALSCFISGDVQDLALHKQQQQRQQLSALL